MNIKCCYLRHMFLMSKNQAERITYQFLEVPEMGLLEHDYSGISTWDLSTDHTLILVN